MLGSKQPQDKYFFQKVWKQTRSVFEQQGVALSATISLCGLKVRLDFTSATFAPKFLNAIAHLMIFDQSQADYCVQIWSEDETGIPMPSNLRSYQEIQLRGDIPSLSSDDVKSAYFTHSRTLNIIDLKERVAVVCAKSFKYIPAFEIACPLRAVFSWILQENQMTFIHAAAVGNQSQAILIGGDSGVGKSTTAISCLEFGMDYLGDDVCAISLQDTPPKVFSVYSSAKIMTKAINQFTFLMPYQANLYTHAGTPLEKQVYFLKNMNQISSSKRAIKALVMPSFETPSPLLKPFSLGRAARILGASTSSLIPGSNALYLSQAAQLTRSVPVLQLNLSADFERNYKCIKSLLHTSKF